MTAMGLKRQAFDVVRPSMTTFGVIEFRFCTD
jgi:hypothetical protein